MAKQDDRLPDYQRPEMDFERKAAIGPGAAQWTAIGIEFAVYVVLFFLGGKWLDGKFGWEPWGAAMGGLLGAVVGTTVLIRRVLRASAAEERTEEANRRKRGSEGE